MSEGTKRRDFLKYTAATGMGYWVAGTKTWAQEADTKTPNEKVNFACVGVSGKGGSDSSHAAEVGNVVAICDANEKNLEGKARALPKARKFTDFRKMFDEMGKEFDAVTVSIPDHNHAVVAMHGDQKQESRLRSKAHDPLHGRGPRPPPGRGREQGRHADGQPGQRRERPAGRR